MSVLWNTKVETDQKRKCSKCTLGVLIYWVVPYKLKEGMKSDIEFFNLCEKCYIEEFPEQPKSAS